MVLNDIKVQIIMDLAKLSLCTWLHDSNPLNITYCFFQLSKTSFDIIINDKYQREIVPCFK